MPPRAWEPLLAVAIGLAAITGLVVFAGRLYTGAILHTGPTLKLRDAWRHATPTSPHAVVRPRDQGTTYVVSMLGLRT